MIYYDINGLPFNEKGNLVISAGTPGNTQIATPADYSSLSTPPSYIPDTNTIINNTRNSSAFQGVETTMGGQKITEGKSVLGSTVPAITESRTTKSSYSSTGGNAGSYVSSAQKPAAYQSQVQMPEEYVSQVQMPAAYDGSGYYTNVGTPESNTPDYSLQYLQGPAGEAYNAAMKQIAADLGERPTYDNKYDLQLQSAYQNIVGRDPFSWSADQDPFYQDYARRYTQLGQQAMKDTMGQAAALTGGYGSTYGQYAGQSAYNQYMSALADKQIELENRAYQRYQDAGNELYKQYSLLGDLRDTEYGRYRDAVSDYNYNLALMQAQEAEDYQRAVYNNNLRIQAEETGYNRYRDALADARYQDQLGYERYRDEVADARYADELGYSRYRDRLNDARYQDELGYSRYRDQLSDYRYEDELGYSRWRDTVSDTRYEDETAYQRGRDAVADDQWQQEFNLKQANASGSGSSGGSGRSSGSGGGGSSSSVGTYGGYLSSGMTSSDVAALQQQLNSMGANLDVDGIMGPKTQAAIDKYMGGTNGGAVEQIGIASNGTPIYGNDYTKAEQAYVESAPGPDNKTLGYYDSNGVWHSDYATIVSNPPAVIEEASTGTDANGNMSAGGFLKWLFTGK